MANLIEIDQKLCQMIADGAPSLMLHSYLSSQGLDPDTCITTIKETENRMMQAKQLATLQAEGFTVSGTGVPIVHVPAVEPTPPGPVLVQTFAEAFGFSEPAKTAVTVEEFIGESVVNKPVVAQGPPANLAAIMGTAPPTLGDIANGVPFASRDQIPHVAIPFPIWEGHPCFIDLGDRKARVVAKTMSNPNAIVFENVLSDEECDEMVRMAEPNMARSTTVSFADGGSEVHEARTSSGTHFSRGQTPMISAVEARLAKLANWPVEKGEPIQLLRYDPGQEYKPHFDYFDPTVGSALQHIQRPGNRVATMIMYLNDVEEGGSTCFPDANLHVMPKKGSVVFFSYGRAHPDSKSLHGGSPVIKGQKYIATKWLREREW